MTVEENTYKVAGEDDPIYHSYSDEDVAVIDVGTSKQLQCQWCYFFNPLTGEYRYGGNQSGWTFKPCARRVYRQALRRFVDDLNMDRLTDRQGKLVDLPLGLKDLK